MVFLESTHMIVKECFIEDLDLKYFIGINQISLNYQDLIELNNLKNDKEALEFLISLASQINEDIKDIVVQFIDDELILNQEHIFKSIYFVQKAFKNNLNISKSKSMEELLYLSSQRQIKKGIEAFGVKIQELKNGKLTYLILSQNNNIDNINQEILQRINGKNMEITINNISIEKLEKIKQYFNISNNQINSIINSYDKQEVADNENLNLSILAIHDILCEKMSILSLEKIKTD